MVFYLSNWITKPVGDFMHATCEDCGSDVFTLLVKRRRWVSFLSLPLIPTSSPEWYHTCPACGAAWELPADAAEDAKVVRDSAESLLAEETDYDVYESRLASFVDEYGETNYADATDTPETRYIQ